ncbi:DUF6296 family protein [Kitasatospora mediocidica]|uniref:DUF6296 family protein n=1 Tax=Kitasatospora mediocidica TaxID=58352 RepID=UPI0007C6BA28
MSDDHYELTFFHEPGPGPDDVPGCDIVLVHRRDTVGPGGHPLYHDDSGTVCAEISDRGEVRMFATGAHQHLRRPDLVRRPDHRPDHRPDPRAVRRAVVPAQVDRSHF